MKNNRFKNLFVLLIILISHQILAQTDDEQMKILEKYIENSDMDVDFNELYEFLNSEKKQKININTASPYQLFKLGFLNFEQIKSILNHRKEFGDFLSYYELQCVDSITIETINKLISFVEISSNNESLNFKSAFIKSNKNLCIYTKISHPRSLLYLDSSGNKYSYKGSPILNRIKFKSNYKNSLIIGINAEKDAGEEFFSGSNKQGFDFYSAFILLNNFKKLKTLIIGDYKADFGQGLVISGGFNTGKNAMITNIKKSNSGIRQYSSFNEIDFLRGTAIVLSFAKTEVCFMISAKNNDVVLDTIFNSRENILIKSFNESGYHRNSVEISGKNKNSEIIAAQNITYSNNNYRFGISSIYAQNKYEEEQGKYLYNKNYYTQKSFFKTGVNWDFYNKNINFYGEAAISSNISKGIICGANISFGNFADFSTVYRNYSKNYIWNHSNSFSENTNSVNEQGVYWGIILFPKRKLQISGFVDLFKFPFYSYNTDGQTKGEDFFTELKYIPDKKSIIYIRFRKKSKLENSDEGNYNNLNYADKSSLRIHAEKVFSKSVTAKFRVEFAKYKSPLGVINKGNLMFADISFKTINFPISVNSRITFFNIDDYNARIYAVENDLLYTWSVPSFYNSGIKYYVMAKLNYGKYACQYKYSILKYYNKSSIGSGYSIINSDKINEHSILIQYSFN
ncbi:MAG: helix-hairpin-helix domain-containing protein [Bacteroidia bacterium]|nr:helix-hairpin-helix domain-containing protein [Bacteroidia bacterium]